MRTQLKEHKNSVMIAQLKELSQKNSVIKTKLLELSYKNSVIGIQF